MFSRVLPVILKFPEITGIGTHDPIRMASDYVFFHLARPPAEAFRIAAGGKRMNERGKR